MAYVKGPITGLALAASLMAPLYAAPGAYDADGDGIVTITEIQSTLPTMSEGTFAVIDVSGDGVLTDDEVANATIAGLLPRV